MKQDEGAILKYCCLNKTMPFEHHRYYHKPVNFYSKPWLKIINKITV